MSVGRKIQLEDGSGDILLEDGSSFLLTDDANVNVSQAAVEIVTLGEAAARVSQTAVELVSLGEASARVSQVVVEVVSPNYAEARVSQVTLEIVSGDRRPHIFFSNVEVTGQVDKSTLQLIFQNSQQSNTASMDVTNIDPLPGERVYVCDGPNRIFGGIIQRVVQKSVRGNEVSRYGIECVDWTWLFNRRRVTKTYVAGTSCTAIILDLVSAFTSGFTTNGVFTGAPATTGDLVFRGEIPSVAMQKVADAIGWKWYIDPYLDLYFYTTETSPRGGTPSVSSNKVIRTFTANDTFVAPSDGLIEYFIVGGGGGGGLFGGGGGGGGGIVHGSETIVAGSYPIIVGPGGAGASFDTSNIGSSGGLSAFNGHVANGGGAGGDGTGEGPGFNGAGGGCGGGGSFWLNSAGGTGSQGGNGGAGNGGSSGNTPNGGGGGGAAPANGVAAGVSSGGDGAAGLTSFITGDSVTYAGGGGGGTSGTDTPGVGGSGGGGAGANEAAQIATAGTANTGGGGGGTGSGAHGVAGTGGSGIVILSYQENAFPAVPFPQAQPVSLSTLNYQYDSLEYQLDLSQIRTRVFVVGGGGQTTAPVAAAAATVPVDECSWYAGGTRFVVGGSIVTYTGVSAGSGPGNLTGCTGIATALKQGDTCNILVQQDDTTAQAVLAMLEEGDGIHEDWVEDGNLNIASATQKAASLMVGFRSYDVRGRYTTYDTSTRVGRLLTIDLPRRGINTTVTLQRMTQRLVSPITWFYQVDFSITWSDLIDVFAGVIRPHTAR